MSKIALLYEMLNRDIIQFGIFNKLSVDESMVPCFDRHSAKMFIKGKAIRFGFKIWYLCGSDSYSYNIKIYQEKEKKFQDQLLGSRVINNMVDAITANFNALLHELYFDNFFTSYCLMSDLVKIDVRAIGTIRKNRTACANQKMIISKQLEKQERGCFEYYCDATLYIAKWHDNLLVTIASNCESHIPVHKVRRRVKGGVKEVPQPHFINSYNKWMGASISWIACGKLTSQQYVVKNGTGHFLSIISILRLSLHKRFAIRLEIRKQPTLILGDK